MTWEEEQTAAGVPMIELTYKVTKPNGEITEVNRFDFNLAWCVDKAHYIQCADTSWVRVGLLTVLDWQEVRA